MALDYQKKTYVPHRPETKFRTTYNLSNHWVDFFGQERKMQKEAKLNLRSPTQIKKLYDESRQLQRDLRRLEKNPHGTLPESLLKTEVFDIFTPNFPSPTKQRSPSYSMTEKMRRRYEPKRDAMEKAAVTDDAYAHHLADMFPEQGDMFTPNYKLPDLGKVGQTHNIHQLAQGSDPAHLQYFGSGGYDDWHKASLKASLQKQMMIDQPHVKDTIYGPQKLRNGHAGGSWRHVKEPLQPGGKRLLFVDGAVARDDLYRVRTKLIKTPETLMREPNSHDLFREIVRHRKATPIKTTHYTSLSAHKGTEKGNWYIMR
ncbi:uncharacterized protein LOC106150392 [Lingula anatina]|uniref:Uncharacterized protein LOC106150392 n=1 Tax=Lingula anatina TaxID=7574 RepID=A0A1S3H0B0_LINAN|nr:uncharacterized protein LOC106150392 [Lingula anatina]|eukprot:XP_013378604.1 uncharacterized protein LOC106150392 [Lingula anatina]